MKFNKMKMKMKMKLKLKLKMKKKKNHRHPFKLDSEQSKVHAVPKYTNTIPKTCHSLKNTTVKSN